MVYFKRTIRCPNHFFVKPGVDPFVIKPHPINHKLNHTDIKRLGLKTYAYVRDRWGNKILDFKKCFQPIISAAFAIEHIYDPDDDVCKRCGRCLEGFSGDSVNTISRLTGK